MHTDIGDAWGIEYVKVNIMCNKKKSVILIPILHIIFENISCSPTFIINKNNEQSGIFNQIRLWVIRYAIYCMCHRTLEYSQVKHLVRWTKLKNHVWPHQRLIRHPVPQGQRVGFWRGRSWVQITQHGIIFIWASLANAQFLCTHYHLQRTDKCEGFSTFAKSSLQTFQCTAIFLIVRWGHNHLATDQGSYFNTR